MIDKKRVPKLRFPEFEDAGQWEEKKLGEVADIASGSTPLRSNLEFYNGGNIPWVKTGDLNNSFIFSTEEYITSKANSRINQIDTILVAMYGGFNQIGRTGYLKIPAATNQAISSLTVNKLKLIPLYLLIWLNAKVEYWKKIASSSRKDPNITGRDVISFPIQLPSLPEQQKIADCLSSLGELINAHTKKHETLKTYKKGLMQKLFPAEGERVPELRFPEFKDAGEWEEKRLEEVLIKNSERNHELKYSLVQSVSNKYGFIKQDEYFENRRVASEETSNYYIIKKGYFAYNPSRIDVGSLAYKYDEDICIISPLYVSFQTSKSIVDSYLLNWFFTNGFTNKMKNALEGGVRNTLSYENLKTIEILLPILPEQQKIADCLSSLDELINAESKKIEALKVHKKGLMQGMFPDGGD